MQLVEEKVGQTRPSIVPLAALGVVYLALLGLLYWKAVLWWHSEWTAEGSYYAHGVFVPFFIGAMLWRDREKLKRLPVSRSWWGLLPMGLAILMIVYAYRADVTVTLSVSFMLFLLGTVMLAAGGRVTRALLIPMLFLFTMIPIIPNQVINVLAIPIQRLSAMFAATALNLVGFPATRVGTQIAMEDYYLAVEVPCSGFKTLIGLLSFSGAFGYLIEAALWKRWFLFLIALPLSIIVNGVRITLIGIVGQMVSAPAAATFHDYSGFIVLILGFMVLFGLARVLKCQKLLDMSLQDDDEDGVPEETREERRVRLDARYGAPRPDSLHRLAMGLVPVLVMLGLACGARLMARPDRSAFNVMKASQVPVDLGTWARLGNKDNVITSDVIATLQPEVCLDRLYAGNAPQTGVVSLFLSGGSSRHTFHDPHDCFNGSGLILDDKGVETIETPAGPVSVQVSEAEDPAKKTRRVVMFVYIVDGKQMSTMAGVHWKIIGQSLFGVKTRPFYFLRFVQGVDGTQPERYAELRSFIRALWPTVKDAMTKPRLVAGTDE